MPDEATPKAALNADLDDLERRLASFEQATRRLGRTVSDLVEPGHSSPPRSGTRRLKESGAPRSEEPSGLRPAVASQEPPTGALAARSRNGTEAAAPGFTSKFGKPSIPAIPATAPTVQARTTGRGVRRHASARGVLVGAVVALLLGLLALPQLFTVLPDAAIWAERRTLPSTVAGKVDAVPVRVGDRVGAGLPVIRVAGQDLASPVDGTVTRLPASPGTWLAIGETAAEIALPETCRVVAALPTGLELAIGDRVRVQLLEERRFVEANVELILAAGAPGPWTNAHPAPRRAIIRAAPNPRPLSLGQEARVTVIGGSSGRLLLYALREMLPW